jgi:hypothetical protein
MIRDLLECSFYIPRCRDSESSDGRLHSTRAWKWLSDQLYVEFRGATIAPGWHEGFYEDPNTGQRVPDRSRKYTVAVGRRELNRLRALLAQACVRFHQKMIYLSVAGKVEFIEAEGNEPSEDLS